MDRKQNNRRMEVKMSIINLNNISTSYCLEDINIEINNNEFIVILGSSGAGKSTLLNVISGLKEYTGEVFYNNQNMDKIPTEERNIGYLMQDVYLFPHMKVYDNIAFGLKARSYSKNIINKKIEEIFNLLKIKHLKNRYPKDLSGGEKQRVALARALVTEPEILLLDEPLSSLDPKAAKEIREELAKLHKYLNLTTILVTHNFTEAKTLADRIIIISKGILIQYESASKVFNKPDKRIESFISVSGC